MKILITSDWYEPVTNGVVTSVSNLCRGLEEAGHEVRILTLSDSIHARKAGKVYYLGSVNMEIVYPNARVSFNLHHFRRGTKARNCEFLKELIAWNPDIVHSQCEFSTFLFAKKIAERCHVPLVHLPYGV